MGLQVVIFNCLELRNKTSVDHNEQHGKVRLTECFFRNYLCQDDISYSDVVTENADSWFHQILKEIVQEFKRMKPHEKCVYLR